MNRALHARRDVIAVRPTQQGRGIVIAAGSASGWILVYFEQALRHLPCEDWVQAEPDRYLENARQG